jgi:predicted nucleotidyltransferase
VKREVIAKEICDLIYRYYSDDIDCIYGFGSFFRSPDYNDIDLIAVSSKKEKDELKIYKRLLEDLGLMAIKFQTKFDLTYLKSSEFEYAPILERDGLIEIYKTKI